MSLILDSGAYSAWTSGTEISLDDYICFCKDHPEISYYVSLDVISGKPTDRKVRREVVEEGSDRSWKNYQRMIRELPFEKVIPVFHQIDSLRWLDRYLGFGVPYLGISPNQRFSSKLRLDWLLYTVKPRLPSALKTHGFGFTSLDMLALGWTSVDSARWIHMGAMGSILVPKRTRGQWDFLKTPTQVAVTSNQSRGFTGAALFDGALYSVADTRYPHYSSLTPLVRAEFDEWLLENNMSLGDFEIVEVPDNYKLIRKRGGWSECFVGPRTIVRPTKAGVVSNHLCRKWMNMMFTIRLAEVIPVEKLYFAGHTGYFSSRRFEEHMPNRLLSYFYWLRRGSEISKTFEYHFARMREEQADVGSQPEEERKYRHQR